MLILSHASVSKDDVKRPQTVIASYNAQKLLRRRSQFALFL